jgi:membrane fusion protein (multidrug efflux system)
MPRRRTVDAVIPRRRKFPAVVRVLRRLLARMQERSTAVICLLAVLSVGVAVVLIRQGASLALITGCETTDDAYVRADQVAISSHIAGYVDTVPVRDNETVSQGQVIATIRDDDYRARLVSAEAELQAARSAVDVLNAQAIVQRTRVTGAQADVRSAEAGLKQMRLEHARQRALVGDGTTSRRDLEAAEADEQRLAANRDQKIADLGAAQQMLQVIDHEVDQALQTIKAKEAARDLARIDLGYTRIVSPVTGQLSARIALQGEYVTAGTQIGLVVPLPNVWIVANFREVQIAHMRLGQAVTVTVDSVPGRTFQGTVDSIGPASGALQALLPPDNATGNFTKVAQRFAVKIDLAPEQAGLDRLRPGMSAIAKVAASAEPRERSATP